MKEVWQVWQVVVTNIWGETYCETLKIARVKMPIVVQIVPLITKQVKSKLFKFWEYEHFDEVKGSIKVEV